MRSAGCLPTNLRCTRLTRKIVVFSSNCTKSSAPTSVHPNNGIHCRVGRIQVCLPFRIGRTKTRGRKFQLEQNHAEKPRGFTNRSSNRGASPFGAHHAYVALPCA